MIVTCKLCGKKGEFVEEGFEEHRRYRCPNCEARFIPWILRHFGNKYHRYPKWVSREDWDKRTFASRIVIESVKLN